MEAESVGKRSYLIPIKIHKKICRDDKVTCTPTGDLIVQELYHPAKNTVVGRFGPD
jgi:hypothetical protein